ncbi:hypothetical protein [Nonomuraea fuscirosea]|uniref:hypothetical protein n=1 Tax=Nonomuraea fuscirosea TaxID=1291556 RepID=UPI0011B229B4|nr:hypothetical protein [Nonomuraea fuscirosea]
MLAGRMDKSRIWVQVKGTTADFRFDQVKLPSALGSIKVDHDLALRWLGSADLVVVVRWSVIHQTGWYLIPKLSLRAQDFWDEDDNPIASIRLRFQQDHPFDGSAAHKLAWIARLDNAANGIERAPLGSYGRRDLDPATRDSVWKLMGDLELIKISSSGGGALSPELWNSVMLNLLDSGPEFGNDDNANIEYAKKWIDRSFESIVRRFVCEQLPHGVSLPEVLFKDMYGMLRVIRAITTTT